MYYDYKSPRIQRRSDNCYISQAYERNIEKFQDKTQIMCVYVLLL